MTKKKRVSDRSRRQTQRKDGSRGKLSDKTSLGKENPVVVRAPKMEESEDLNEDSEVLQLEDQQEVIRKGNENGSESELIRRPTFNIKQADFLQLTPDQASRILHPNPCCFLTTISDSAKSSSDDSPKLNAMTLSWITPANNYGGFVFVIHKTRFSANSIVSGSGMFTLSVAHAGLRSALLACGKVSGRTTDKFNGEVEGLKAVGSSKLCTPKDEMKSFTASNSFSALGGDSDCDSDNDNEAVDNEPKGINSRSLDLDDKIHAIAPPIQGTVAHLSCRVVQHSDAADAGHWLITAQIEDAFVHASYWDGKCFQPKEVDLPPLLSFLGSQRFGFMMPEE